MNIFQVHSTKAFVLCKRGGTKKEIDPEIAVYLGTIFILCKGVLRLFRTTHSNTYLRTFSLHKVSKKMPFSEPNDQNIIQIPYRLHFVQTITIREPY